MSSDSNQENSVNEDDSVFGSYPSIPQNEEKTQSTDTYSPSLNSGIFGSYYTTPQNNYSPSLNSGIFGSYTYTPLRDTYRLVQNVTEEPNFIQEQRVVLRDQHTKFSNSKYQDHMNEDVEDTKEEDPERYYRPVPHYELPPAKSIATEYKQIYKKYTNIQFDETKEIEPLDNNIKPVFDSFKIMARQTGNAFVKVQENVDFNKSGISNTIGLDIDVKTFNKHKFIRQYCELYGLHESQVNIIGVKAGSCIVDVYISNNGEHQVDLSQLGDRLNDPKVKEKVKEMKAFCILFSKPDTNFAASFANVNVETFKNRKACFNSAYDRAYGPGKITWDGDLQDGKNRGNKPYYCPVGWFKRAVTYKIFSSIDFDKKFHGWPIAYHGTSFRIGMGMLLTGFVPSSRGAYKGGTYVTPSITYAAHPRYAKPKKIPEGAKQGLKAFGEGDWIQFAFQVRVNPAAKIKWDKPETLVMEQNMAKIDPNFDNSQLEWVIDSPFFQDPTNNNCNIYIVGLMIRVTKDHPSTLPESKWWFNYDVHRWDEN